MTGFANFETPMSGKWLELLKTLVPDIARVGYLSIRIRHLVCINRP